jgi:hypothetical protein
MEDLYIQFYKNVNLNDIDMVLQKKLENSRFIYNTKYSKEYKNVCHDKNVFVIELLKNKYNPLLYFINSRKNLFTLVNIDINNNQIKDDDYDREYSKIMYQLKNEVRRNKYFKIVIINKAEKLEDIITSNICRKKLEHLIQMFPNSYHPFDINRIDKIIWSIYIYSRKTIDLNNLKEYLYNNDMLDKEYVDFLINRIRSGLQLLYINSNKYKY